MRRSLIIVLATLLAIPLAPSGPFGMGVGTAFADDDFDDFDDFDDLRIPRFEIPRFRVPRLQRVPRRRAPPAQPVPAVVIPDAVPGEVVVGALSEEALALIVADGFTVVASASTTLLGGIVARLTPPPSIALEAARQRVLQIVPDATVEPNHLYRPVELPCRHGDCPAFEMVGWTVPPHTCDIAGTIGMVDTAVNAEHEALRHQSVEVVSVLGRGTTRSSAVHGTAIAALLVGDEATRTPGLLPNAKLVAVEAFHRDVGGDAADVYHIVRAIDLLAGRGIRVINLSFAGPANALLGRAVQAAADRNAILVAAAGNEGPNADPAFPAAHEDVVAVTAIDRNRQVFRDAGRGEHIAFAAPGVRLWTAASISGGRFRSGTSYAVPFVSAALAAALARDADRPAAALIRALAARSVDLGDAGRDATFGWGLVNAPACGMSAGGAS